MEAGSSSLFADPDPVPLGTDRNGADRNGADQNGKDLLSSSF